MIQFNCRKYKNKVPFISDAEIDIFAEAVINDYRPKMFKEVMPIDYMHFLESYLGLDFRFADIYFGSGEEPILGATAFNDGDKLKIFDKQRERSDKITLQRGSVALDNSLTADNMERRQLFTGLHEGGHWMMHQLYYSKNREQFSFFEPAYDIACCRTSDIEPRGKRELVTDEDFLEHQANVFASAIAMPRAAVLRITPTVFSELNLTGSRLHIRKDDQSYSAQDEVVFAFSEIFNVSRQAAKIRLEKLKIIVDSDGNDLLTAQ